MSHARNVGIDISNGEYISFVDSDDVIAPTYCEKLLSMLLEDKSDVSACSYIRFSDENTLKMHETSGESKRICLKRHDVWKNIVGNECSAEGFLWNKMFRRSTIGRMRFDESLRMSEDQWFVFQVLSHVNLISVCSDELYYYRRNSGSATANLDVNGYDQAIYVAKQLLQIVSEDETAVQQYRNYVAGRCFDKAMCIMSTGKENKYSDIKKTRREYLEFKSGAINTKAGYKNWLGECLFRINQPLFMLYQEVLNMARTVKMYLLKH